ncbi:MAG: PaaI family thioesterase [Pseudomonadota bacterium]
MSAPEKFPGLPGHLGVQQGEHGEGWLEMTLPVADHLMAPNGFLHAGSIVTLADFACGMACVHHLPDGAAGFTTIELKTNFLGAARDGTLHCRAEADHLGKATQVWSAKVTHAETGKTIALFRCTQMVLRAK